MRRATHIRSKLGLALAVPLLALVALAGFEVVASIDAVQATRTESGLATVAIRSTALITHLQDERDAAALELVGLDRAAAVSGSPTADLQSAVDASRGDLANALATASKAGALVEANAALTGLDALRSDVAKALVASAAPAPEVADTIFARYESMIRALSAATSSIDAGIDDATLRAGVQLVTAATEQSEVRALLAWEGAQAVLTDRVGATAVSQELAALQSRAQYLTADIASIATGPFADLADQPQAGGFDDAVEELLGGRPVGAAVLLAGMPGADEAGYRELRATAARVLASQADRSTAAALSRQWVFGAFAMAIVLLAPLLTWLAVRSITRPLSSLRQQATDMAETHLPAAVRQILDTPFGEDVVIPEIDAIQVRSSDEVASVAKALSAVQTSALNLAVEQAVLRRNISDSYINLGRRNQNLLGRQLDFITDLERNESDPDTLEGLFRLDHLATRMRRNAESLLVLAGVEAPRQWAAPVRMSDVVRAALGEVEDYQRVVIRHLEPASLSGAVAADVAHITAELIENALSFSAPDQQVEVKGRLTVDGYTVAISDNGFGMPADDLAKANRRLAGAESFTVAPSRYLGHYVAGHLASRLGVVVSLQASPAGGITARVDVPMGLVADDETDPRLNKQRGEALRDAQRAEVEREVTPALAAPEVAVHDESMLDDPAALVTEASPAAQTSVTRHGLQRRGHRVTEVGPAVEPAAEVGPAVEPAAEVDVEVDVASEDAPVTDPGPAQEAPDPALARGFGGLAVTRPTGPSLFTVTARNARNGGSASAERGAEPHATTTGVGLTRRVPGAQRPDVPVGSARPEDAPWGTAKPQPSSPEDTYSFLSRFQSGVERGRADGQAGAYEGDLDTKPVEDFG